MIILLEYYYLSFTLLRGELACFDKFESFWYGGFCGMRSGKERGREREEEGGLIFETMWFSLFFL